MKKLYTAVCIVIVNLMLLAGVLNMAADLYMRHETATGVPLPVTFSMERVPLVYPGKGQQEITDLLRETWSRPLQYTPFLQFSEATYKGRYIHRHVNGYRVVRNQGPWPPSPDNFNIFAFGGSTLFGYGVADSETIPSYLQEHLQAKSTKTVCVYNFANGYYYSTQELILLQRLLSRGYRPDLAIFLDGHNEFHMSLDRPHLTKRIERFFYRMNNQQGFWSQALFSTALARLIGRFTGPPAATDHERVTNVNELLAFHQADSMQSLLAVGTSVERILHRYHSNILMIRAVASAFDVECMFFWQPVAVYNHKQTAVEKNYANVMMTIGYRRMAETKTLSQLEKQFVWLADVQPLVDIPIYIDRIHYTAAFSVYLAGRIGDRIAASGALRELAR